MNLVENLKENQFQAGITVPGAIRFDLSGPKGTQTSKSSRTNELLGNDYSYSIKLHMDMPELLMPTRHLYRGGIRLVYSIIRCVHAYIGICQAHTGDECAHGAKVIAGRPDNHGRIGHRPVGVVPYKTLPFFDFSFNHSRTKGEAEPGYKANEFAMCNNYVIIPCFEQR